MEEERQHTVMCENENIKFKKRKIIWLVQMLL